MGGVASERHASSTRRWWIVGLSVALAAALPLWGWPWLRSRNARADAAAAIAELGRCLCGDPAGCDRAAQRRHILAQDRTPTSSGEGCVTAAATLERATEILLRDCPASCRQQQCEPAACNGLTRVAAAVRDSDAALSTDLLSDFDLVGLRRDASAADLLPAGPSTQAGGRASAAPTPSSGAAPRPLFPYGRTSLSASADGRQALLLNRPADADPQVCWLASGGTKLDCRRLALPALSPSDRLLALDAHHVIGLGAGGGWLQRQSASQTLRWRGSFLGAHATTAGAAWLVRDESGPQLRRLPTDSPGEHDTQAIPSAAHGPVLVAGQLLHTNDRQLQLRPAWAASAADPPAANTAQPLTIDLALAAEQIAGVEGCSRSDGRAHALLVRGKARGYDTPLRLLRATPNGWSNDVQRDIHTTRFGLTCSRNSIAVTWIDPLAETAMKLAAPLRRKAVAGRYRIRRIFCPDGSACRDEEASLSVARYDLGSPYIVTSLGDKLALLWRSRLGDVRMRLATPNQLAQAADQFLFDGAEHGGFDWDGGGEQLRIYDDAILLLATRSDAKRRQRRTFLLRIAQDGSQTWMAPPN